VLQAGQALHILFLGRNTTKSGVFQLDTKFSLNTAKEEKELRILNENNKEDSLTISRWGWLLTIL
jgi:hypothetical protein